MRESWQPFDAGFGESEAQAGRALSDACAYNGGKPHKERCAVRKGDGHENILKQTRESGTFKTDVEINRPVNCSVSDQKG